MPSTQASTHELLAWTLDLEQSSIELSAVNCKRFTLEHPFIEICRSSAKHLGTNVFLSGGNSESAKFNILGTTPWLSIVAGTKATKVSLLGNTHWIKGDPFAIVDSIVSKFSLPYLDTDLPFTSGLMGYFAYDLKDQIENLPRTSIDDLGLPTLHLSAPAVALVQSLESDEVWFCEPQLEGLNSPQRSYLDNARNRALALLKNCDKSSKPFCAHSLEFEVDKEDFVRAVNTLRVHIGAGDTFQVNLSHRIKASFEGDAFCLFLNLFEKNPAPFFAFINAGDHQVLSTSPERFIQCKNGMVETRPIKGTRPRGSTASEDQAMLDDLRQSNKDNAELTMIVDLLRNDLAKVCSPGSIKLNEHRLCESYQNVHHSLSIIGGELERSFSQVDLLRSTFPSGSVTGCPKLRAMELIDEFEPTRRHVYCGSIGYLSFHNTMDLNVAIRTATIKANQIYYPIGAGIVFDSNAESEYQETLDKGMTFLGELTAVKNEKTPNQIWLDGRLVEETQAQIPLLDYGIQYGIGLFETIRANNGRIEYLAEHISRFSNSWTELFDSDFPDLSWQDVINQVLKANNLLEQCARVKIQSIARSTKAGLSSSYHLAVTADIYQPRATNESEGLALRTYPEPRQTPLASHKTLNYMYYNLAKSWAEKRGADEALILNPDQTISETNTANILLVKDSMAIRPKSKHVLPGIMESAVCKALARFGYEVWQREMFTHDLPNADAVILTNSLMGAVSAKSLDGIPLEQDNDLVKRLNLSCLN